MITKNKQSRETIVNMAQKAFPDKQITEIKELTEGMCNVTYNIAFDDGSESILKIAAKDRSGNTSNEVNLMQAEVNAMRLAAGKCSCKVADVQYYDTSNTVCDGNYFFMEKLPGDNFFLIRENLSEEVSEETSADTTEEVSEEASEDVSEDTSEDVSEEISKDVEEDFSEVNPQEAEEEEDCRGSD